MFLYKQLYTFRLSENWRESDREPAARDSQRSGREQERRSGHTRIPSGSLARATLTSSACLLFPHCSPSTCLSPTSPFVSANAPPVFPLFSCGPLRTSNMSESCDLRGLRHCLALALGLALISLPWAASFLGPRRCVVKGARCA